MGIEINRIVKQFEGLQHGECWIGNNFKATLHDVDAAQAAKTITLGGNSIWLLTAHLIYWRTTAVNRLTGSTNPPPFKDFTLPNELHEASWKQALHDFEAVYHSLRTALHNIKDEQLDKPSPREGQSFYQLILGVLQHDAYHLGQMMLLKKSI